MPFWKKKINLKNAPQKRHRFEKKKRKKKKKKKKEEEERWGSPATPKPLFFFFGKLHPLSRLNHNLQFVQTRATSQMTELRIDGHQQASPRAATSRSPMNLGLTSDSLSGVAGVA
jgi:hypothetical protein